MQQRIRVWRWLMVALVLIGMAGSATWTLAMQGPPNGPQAIEAVPDFALALEPDTRTVVAGETTTLNVTVRSLNDYTEPVTLRAEGLPPGSEASFAPNPVTPGGAATLALTTTAATPAGDYAVTVVGTSVDQAHSVQAVIHVQPPAPEPDFAVAATPQVVGVYPGETARYTVSLTALNGFDESVALTMDGVPPAAMATFAPPQLTPPGTATLFVSTTVSAEAGDYALTITGTSQSRVHATQAVLQVLPPAPDPDFSLIVTPTAAEAYAGQGVPYSVTIAPLHGFTDPVTVTVSGVPSGTQMVPEMAVATSPGMVSFILTPTAETPLGEYLLAFEGVGGGREHAVQAALHVIGPPPEPDFVVTVSPSDLTVERGEMVTTSVTIVGLNGFAESVALDLVGLPVGTLSAFEQTPLAPGAATTLIITATPNAHIGDYALTIVGDTGDVSHVTEAVLHVREATEPDFALVLTPTTQAVAPGRVATYTVGVIGLGGFSSPVHLTATDFPEATFQMFTPSFTVNPVIPSGESQLVLQTSGNVQPGTYGFRVIGTAESLTRTVDASIGISLLSNRIYLPLILSNYIPVHAAYHFTPEDTFVGVPVAFTEQATGPVTAWHWDFGDGSDTVTERNPLHAYAETGTFTITLTVSNATDVDQATRSITVREVTGTQLLENGGFETDAAWEFGTPPVPAGYTEAAARTGSRSMRHGIVPPAADADSYSSAFQRVTIPADATAAYLSYWYWPRSQAGEQAVAPLGQQAVGHSLAGWRAMQAAAGQDRQYAMLLDSTRTTILATLMEVTQDRAGWQRAVFDLSAYRGRTLYVYFDAYNNGDGSRTWMYVDDVELLSQAAPVAAFSRSPLGLGVAGSPVTFYDESEGAALSLTWDFGWGVIKTGSVVTHTYGVTGTHPVTLTATNPWGSDVAVGSVTVIKPLAGEELLENGGFETDVAWEFGSTPVPADYTDTLARTGSRSMRHGIVPPAGDVESYSSSFQRVTVPSDAAAVYLSYWYWPRSEAEGDTVVPLGRQAVGHSLASWQAMQATAGQDRQYAMLLDSARTTILATLMEVSQDRAGWQRAVFDLSAYRGRTIYVYFDAYNDGDGANTWMYVDDVTLIAVAE